jgi:hypothetical protein
LPSLQQTPSRRGRGSVEDSSKRNMGLPKMLPSIVNRRKPSSLRGAKVVHSTRRELERGREK